jgi:hypothetical protein
MTEDEDMADTSGINDKERIGCNKCMGETWHQPIAQHTVSFPVYDLPFASDREVIGEVEERWEMLRCLGCDSISVRKTIAEISDLGSEEVWKEYYPERTRGHHRIKNYWLFPSRLAELYVDVVNAFNNESLLLCAAGLRLLLEGICLDKGISEGPNRHGKVVSNLEGRINGLKSVVPQNIVKNLHGIRFLGNKALHELEVPTNDDVQLALIVIEDILKVVYDLDYHSQMLQEKLGS